MTGEAGIDGGELAGEALVVDAGAAAGPVATGAAKQAGGDGCRGGGVADAHFAEADEVEIGRHRIIAGRDGAKEIGLVHRRCLGEVAGGALELEWDDRELGSGETGKLVDGSTAGSEIGDHLHRHFGRVGRHALSGYAMIAGEDDDLDLVEPRHLAALPAAEPGGDFFELAEAAARLGQRVLAAGDGVCGGIVACREVEAGCAQFIK